MFHCTNPSSSDIQTKLWMLLVISGSSKHRFCMFLTPPSQHVHVPNSRTQLWEKSSINRFLTNDFSCVFLVPECRNIILIPWQELASHYFTIHPLSSPQTPTNTYTWAECWRCYWEWFMNLKVCVCCDWDASSSIKIKFNSNKYLNVYSTRTYVLLQLMKR